MQRTHKIYIIDRQQVMNPEYLGILLSEYKTVKEEVKEQITKAKKIARYLNYTIWRNKYLRTETQSRIYNSVLRLTMTYSDETRPDTKKTNKMKILRRVKGKY